MSAELDRLQAILDQSMARLQRRLDDSEGTVASGKALLADPEGAAIILKAQQTMSDAIRGGNLGVARKCAAILSNLEEKEDTLRRANDVLRVSRAEAEQALEEGRQVRRSLDQDRGEASH